MTLMLPSAGRASSEHMQENTQRDPRRTFSKGSERVLRLLLSLLALLGVVVLAETLCQHQQPD